MFYSAVKLILVAAALTLGIAGCASVPLTSLPKLMRLDVETVDMSAIELAVRVEDNVGLVDGSGKLELIVENDRTGEVLSHTLKLETDPRPLTRFLMRKSKPGYHIKRFKMTPEQVVQAEVFRQKAIAMRKAAKGKTSGSFSASVRFCDYPDQPRYTSVKLTFFVRTRPDKDFFTLLKQQDMSFERDMVVLANSQEGFCDEAQ